MFHFTPRTREALHLALDALVTAAELVVGEVRGDVLPEAAESKPRAVSDTTRKAARDASKLADLAMQSNGWEHR